MKIRSNIKAGTNANMIEGVVLQPASPITATSRSPLLWVPVWWIQKQLTAMIAWFQKQIDAWLAKQRTGKERFWEIDVIRGGAVVMMVILHAMHPIRLLIGVTNTRGLLSVWYQLRTLIILLMQSFFVFAGMTSGSTDEPAPVSGSTFIKNLRQNSINTLPILLLGAMAASLGAGAGLFMVLVGWGLSLSFARAQPKELDPRLRYVKRGFMTLGFGLAISLFSYLLMPTNFIRFGIISCIGLSIILAIPFLTLSRWWSLAGGVGIMGLLNYRAQFSLTPLLNLILGLGPHPIIIDYFPLVPWLGAMLGGIFIGKTLYPEGQRAFAWPDLSEKEWVQKISTIGQLALPIYLLHIPFFIMSVAFGGL